MNEWREVSWIEAANASVAGTHEVQRRVQEMSWGEAQVFGPSWKYQIREKQRTITVTIPTIEGLIIAAANDLRICFSTVEQRDTALSAIRAAMEQKP